MQRTKRGKPGAAERAIGQNSNVFPCIACKEEVTTTHQALECDSCSKWQHRKCGTGITPAEYRKAVQARGGISWLCSDCKPRIHVEVKVLDKKAPLLFAWWNREEQSVETCLVTCRCQGFQLVDSEKLDAYSEFDRPGKQALRLTRAVECSRVVSVLTGDLVPDVFSTIDYDRNRRRGSRAEKKKKKKYHRKENEEDGLNGQELAKDNRGVNDSSPGGIAEDGKVVLGVHESGDLWDISKDAQTLPQDPPLHPSGTAHPFTSGTLGDSVFPSHISSDSQIPPVERSAPPSPIYVSAGGLHRGATGGNSADIIGNVCSTPMDDGETSTAVPIATEVNISSTLQERVSQVQEEGGSEEDSEEDMEGSLLDMSALLENPEASPTANVADVDRGESSKSIPKKKSKKKRKNKYILCDQCGKTLIGRGIRTHMEIVHREGGRKKTYRCDQCPVAFYYEAHLRRHIEESHKGVRYKCRFCDKPYVQDWNRKIHENVHFPKDQPVFISKRETARHKKYVYPNKNVVCEVCGKTLKKSSLSAHMKNHSSEMFKCEICGTMVKIGSKYAHMQHHTHKKSQSCPHCIKTFHCKSVLRQHIRTHTKEKPIQCRYCDATFSQHGLRLHHERLHTGERPYQCDLCQKSWRDRGSYVSHMKKHHPGRPLMYLKRKPPAKISDRDLIATDLKSIHQEIAGVEEGTE